MKKIISRGTMHLSRNQSRGLAASILAVFVLLVLLPRGTGKPATPSSATMDQAAASPAAEGLTSGAVMLKDFHRSETREGRLVWEVKSARGQYFPLSNSAKVEDAIVRLYRKDGSVVEVAAGEATLDMNGAELNRVNASGGVKLVYNSELTMITESAVFDRENNRVTAPGHVQISSSMIETTGVGLTADLETRTARLDREVQSIIKAREQAHDRKKK